MRHTVSTNNRPPSTRGYFLVVKTPDPSVCDTPLSVRTDRPPSTRAPSARCPCSSPTRPSRGPPPGSPSRSYRSSCRHVGRSQYDMSLWHRRKTLSIRIWSSLNHDETSLPTNYPGLSIAALLLLHLVSRSTTTTTVTTVMKIRSSSWKRSGVIRSSGTTSRRNCV